MNSSSLLLSLLAATTFLCGCKQSYENLEKFCDKYVVAELMADKDIKNLPANGIKIENTKLLGSMGTTQEISCSIKINVSSGAEFYEQIYVTPLEKTWKKYEDGNWDKVLGEGNFLALFSETQLDQLKDALTRPTGSYHNGKTVVEPKLSHLQWFDKITSKDREKWEDLFTGSARITRVKNEGVWKPTNVRYSGLSSFRDLKKEKDIKNNSFAKIIGTSEGDKFIAEYEAKMKRTRELMEICMKPIRADNRHMFDKRKDGKSIPYPMPPEMRNEFEAAVAELKKLHNL